MGAKSARPLIPAKAESGMSASSRFVIYSIAPLIDNCQVKKPQISLAILMCRTGLNDIFMEAIYFTIE
jgi:hypothetical protein